MTRFTQHCRHNEITREVGPCGLGHRYGPRLRPRRGCDRRRLRLEEVASRLGRAGGPGRRAHHVHDRPAARPIIQVTIRASLSASA